ncbi:MAG: hypothetical protein ACI8YP_001060 [Algoriphagus sp.]|jgi:hypothetical protein
MTNGKSGKPIEILRVEKDMKPIFILIFILISMPSSKKQLSDFKWENRLIVTFDIPLEGFDSLTTSDFKDRKLLLFAFKSENLKYSNFEGDIDQIDFLKLSKKYPGFYFLIGLDGGVKSYGKKEDFSISELIKQIDSMPMRQSEISKKDNRNF